MPCITSPGRPCINRIAKQTPTQDKVGWVQCCTGALVNCTLAPAVYVRRKVVLEESEPPEPRAQSWLGWYKPPSSLVGS